MSKNTFVKGAAILGAAGLIVKFLGAVFRLPLAGMIGATGMAYYSPAYYTYTVFVTIATSGIPVAISKMVSERITVGNYEEAHHVYRVSLKLLGAIGAVSFVVMFFGAGIIADLQNIEESKLPMMAVAPALLIVPVMAAYRGYFQGMQNMRPTAISQIIEQVFRVFFGLLLGFMLFRETIGEGFGDYSPGEKGAAGAAFGATIGALGGLAIIFFVYVMSRGAIQSRIDRHENNAPESGRDILRKILVIAVPITIGACITPIMNVIEAPVVVRGLSASGYEAEIAKNLYGQISGFVIPLINMPQVLTMALAMSLVPLISAAHKTRDMEALHFNTSLAMRIAVIIGLPCAAGMAILAEPILLLLFSSRWDEAVNIAPTFAVMAIGVLFVSLVQTVSGILQGVGKQNIPVVNMCIGIVIKIIVTYFLVSIPSINIMGAGIGTLVTYIVVAVLDVWATKKYTGTRFDIGLTFVRPFIATACMGAAAWFVYYVVFGGVQGHKIGCLTAIMVAVIVYAVMLFVTKSITPEELETIPGGSKLAKIGNKLRRR